MKSSNFVDFSCLSSGKQLFLCTTAFYGDENMEIYLFWKRQAEGGCGDFVNFINF